MLTYGKTDVGLSIQSEDTEPRRRILLKITPEVDFRIDNIYVYADVDSLADDPYVSTYGHLYDSSGQYMNNAPNSVSFPADNDNGRTTQIYLTIDDSDPNWRSGYFGYYPILDAGETYYVGFGLRNKYHADNINLFYDTVGSGGGYFDMSGKSTLWHDFDPGTDIIASDRAYSFYVTGISGSKHGLTTGDGWGTPALENNRISLTLLDPAPQDVIVYGAYFRPGGTVSDWLSGTWKMMLYAEDGTLIKKTLEYGEGGWGGVFGWMGFRFSEPYPTIALGSRYWLGVGRKSAIGDGDVRLWTSSTVLGGALTESNIYYHNNNINPNDIDTELYNGPVCYLFTEPIDLYSGPNIKLKGLSLEHDIINLEEINNTSIDKVEGIS